MIKLIVFSVLLNSSDSSIYVTIATEPIKAIEGALFNEYDWIWVIEARRRDKRGQRGRRLPGGGLR